MKTAEKEELLARINTLILDSADLKTRVLKFTKGKGIYTYRRGELYSYLHCQEEPLLEWEKEIENITPDDQTD